MWKTQKKSLNSIGYKHSFGGKPGRFGGKLLNLCAGYKSFPPKNGVFHQLSTKFSTQVILFMENCEKSQFFGRVFHQVFHMWKTFIAKFRNLNCRISQSWWKTFICCVKQLYLKGKFLIYAKNLGGKPGGKLGGFWWKTPSFPPISTKL